MWWNSWVKGTSKYHSRTGILACGIGSSSRRHRLRLENLYNFAQNFDQNGLLGEKWGQNENRAITNFEIDFFRSRKFSFFIQIPMTIFDLKKSKNRKIRFFENFWDRKTSKFFIVNCMKMKIFEIEKTRSQNLWSLDCHFDLTILLINRFGRNFVQIYTDFQCGDDETG